MAYNGRRYDLVAGNGFQTVMARVFAKTFLWRFSCHTVGRFING
jgi:hypothetical protein